MTLKLYSSRVISLCCVVDGTDRITSSDVEHSDLDSRLCKHEYQVVTGVNVMCQIFPRAGKGFDCIRRKLP